MAWRYDAAATDGEPVSPACSSRVASPSGSIPIISKEADGLATLALRRRSHVRRPMPAGSRPRARESRREILVPRLGAGLPALLLLANAILFQVDRPALLGRHIEGRQSCKFPSVHGRHREAQVYRPEPGRSTSKGRNGESCSLTLVEPWQYRSSHSVRVSIGSKASVRQR